MVPKFKKTDEILRETGGFNMIELLISMTIFAIAIMAIASMQFGALKANASSRGVSEAVTMAENQLEQLLLIEYDPGSVDADLTTGTHDGGTVRGYSISWLVTDLDPNPVDTIRIDVTVRHWTRGVRSSITLSTIKTARI